MLNVDVGPDVPAARGTDIALETQARVNSTYANNLKGKFSVQFKESNHLNKNLHDFVLSNKFDYGYNPMGGRRLASVTEKTDTALENNEI